MFLDIGLFEVEVGVRGFGCCTPWIFRTVVATNKYVL